jgi:hypothetical protein
MPIFPSMVLANNMITVKGKAGRKSLIQKLYITHLAKECYFLMSLQLYFTPN